MFAAKDSRKRGLSTLTTEKPTSQNGQRILSIGFLQLHSNMNTQNLAEYV